LGALNLGEVQIQEFGKNTDVLIRIAETTGATDASNNLSAVERVRGELARDFDVRRVEIVGPQVSAELIQTGLMAVVAAIASMLIYIWFRFEWQFSVGAVLALVHDVALTIGLFAILQLDFNLSILAAILTIVGYSMNDTVVVYDRVRENLRKYKKMDLSELLNIAINETLSRTVMTSVTTMLALLSLYILGGEVIRGFTFAMIWGVIVGTYSSIFIASPLLMLLGVKRDWSGTQVN
jgi:preprotein translocase SecF subunit